MEIGEKLRRARAKAELTQEAVANAIGVSRQSISNWETGKFLPDIVSVIRLSDLYSVSLDTLLKDDPKMLCHLEENTNRVKNSGRLRKNIQILAYLGIWTVCVACLWIGIDNIYLLAYCLLVYILILPLAALIVTLLIGNDPAWGRAKWLLPLASGFFYLMFPKVTFSLRNYVYVSHEYRSLWEQFRPNGEDLLQALLFGLLPALLGLGIGSAILALRTRKARKAAAQVWDKKL